MPGESLRAVSHTSGKKKNNTPFLDRYTAHKNRTGLKFPKFVEWVVVVLLGWCGRAGKVMRERPEHHILVNVGKKSGEWHCFSFVPPRQGHHLYLSFMFLLLSFAMESTGHTDGRTKTVFIGFSISTRGMEVLSGWRWLHY